MDNLKLLLDLGGSILKEKGLLGKSKGGTWEYENRHGIKFKLRRYAWDSGIIMEIWWLNEYLRFIPEIKENSTVIDVGAHIGAFSVFIASQFKRVKILAFEPEPNNFRLLTANIKLNGLEKRIFPYRLALSGQSGKKMKFNLHPYNTGMASAVQPEKDLARGKKTSFEASTISLDTLFLRHKIASCDLLKMDCEGCEYPVILNTKTKTLKKTKSLSLEYHQGGEIKQIQRRLKKAGFKTKFDRAIPNKIIGGLVKAPLLSAKRND